MLGDVVCRGVVAELDVEMFNDGRCAVGSSLRLQNQPVWRVFTAQVDHGWVLPVQG